MDGLKIKATSIVILFDDTTNKIVSFDVEPGFEHQWGYGRQRFMAKNTLSGNTSGLKVLKWWFKLVNPQVRSRLKIEMLNFR